MTVKIDNKRISRSKKKAPLRAKSFKKLNKKNTSPFSAVLNTWGLINPSNKITRTFRKYLGGKRKKKTRRIKYI